MPSRNDCVTNCQYPEVLEDAPPTFFRKDVNAFWSIVKNPGVPVTNLISNPSAESNTDGWGSDSGAVLTQVADPYRGVFSIRVDGAGPLIDVTFASLQAFVSPFATIMIPANTEYFAQVAVKACGGDNITARLIIDGIGLFQPFTENSQTVAGNNDWQVLSISSINRNAVPVPIRLYISSDNGSGCNGFEVDGAIMSERKSDFFDGNTNFAGWNGAVNASTSTTTPGRRQWGETINLSSYGFNLIGDEGYGYPPVQLITSNFARRAGASYQRTQVLPRTITLIGRIEDSDPKVIHQRRHELIRDIGLWDVTDCGQEFLLRFQYTDTCGNAICKPLQMAVEYSGGLEAVRTNMSYEQIILQFVANEYPYWQDLQNEGTILAQGLNTYEYEGTAPAPVSMQFFGPLTLNSVINGTNGASIFFGVPGPGFVIPAGQYAKVFTRPGSVGARLFDTATGAFVGPLPINYANSQPGRFRMSPNGAETQEITLDAVGAGQSTITYFNTWLSADSALRNC